MIKPSFSERLTHAADDPVSVGLSYLGIAYRALSQISTFNAGPNRCPTELSYCSPISKPVIPTLCALHSYVNAHHFSDHTLQFGDFAHRVFLGLEPSTNASVAHTVSGAYIY